MKLFEIKIYINKFSTLKTRFHHDRIICYSTRGKHVMHTTYMNYKTQKKKKKRNLRVY